MWPIVTTCTTLEIPTRRWDWDPSATLGWGSRVNGMLVEAPAALVRGHGFKMSARVCPIDLRDRDDCFFQPVTTSCASEVRHTGLQLSDVQSTEEEAQRNVVKACGLLTRSSTVNCSNLLEAWRQVARVVLQVQPEVQAAVEPFLAPFALLRSASYAALHIRRTDKVRESRFVPVCS